MNCALAGTQLATYVAAAITAAQALECLIKNNSSQENINTTVAIMRDNLQNAVNVINSTKSTGAIQCLKANVTCEQVKQWATAGP